MKKKWIEIVINILFWVFSSWLIIYSFSITEHFVEINNGILSENTEHSNELIFFYTIGQPIFALYFYIQIYITQLLSNKTNLRTVFIKLVSAMVLFLLCYYLIVKLFFSDLIYILWFPSLWYGIFIFYTTIAIAYGIIKVWSSMEADKKNLELINKQTELSLLRSQLHPHFLFNTMNNLLSMVDQVRNPKLAKSIDTLSSLLRYVVYENKSDFVSVSKELEFIQDFSALHLLRFEEGEIDYKLKIIGSNDSQLIEKGILLSFVENAFKHGVQPEFKSFIHIDIDITNKAKFLFKIKNSIPPKIDTGSIGGYGLKSTKERLQLAYPNCHSLEIIEEQTIFNVILKINTDEGNNR